MSPVRSEIMGKVQNKEHWSVDPLRGPGPPLMDRVHGLAIFTTPNIAEVNNNKIKHKIK